MLQLVVIAYRVFSLIFMFLALRSGEVSQYQLVEQLKKTTPYQAKFRESLLCVLRMIQMQSYNPAPVMSTSNQIYRKFCCWNTSL